jgi:hypothetical protein
MMNNDAYLDSDEQPRSSTFAAGVAGVVAVPRG